jgi:hypothetical protein
MITRASTFLLLLGLTSSAACGTGAADFDMSVRRVALSLAFTDEEKADPVEPRVVVQLIPAPPEALRPGADLTNIPRSVPAKCPKAPEGAPVVDVGTYGILKPPTTGVYRRHNEGGLTLFGAIAIKIPFPRASVWEISDLTEIPPPSPVEDPTAPLGGVENATDNFPPGEVAGAPMWEYTVTKKLTPQFTLVERYRLTSRRLLLLQRETITTEGSTMFTPDPPISMLEHGDGEGHTWRSAGVDSASGTAMVVEGSLERREPVDVCGTLHDTYRVVTIERLVNLATGDVNSTNEEDPNIYFVASQLGGIVLREDLHFQQTIATADGPAIVEWDYQSTVDSVTPEPLP